MLIERYSHYRFVLAGWWAANFNLQAGIQPLPKNSHPVVISLSTRVDIDWAHWMPWAKIHCSNWDPDYMWEISLHPWGLTIPETCEAHPLAACSGPELLLVCFLCKVQKSRGTYVSFPMLWGTGGTISDAFAHASLVHSPGGGSADLGSPTPSQGWTPSTSSQESI